MANDEISVLSAIRHQPERAAFLFKLSAVTAIALVAWDVMGSWVLPVVAVKAVLVLLLLAYGAAMTYFVGRLMAASRQWTSASAIAAAGRVNARPSEASGNRRTDLDALRRRPDELPPVPVEDDDPPVPESLPEPSVVLSDSTAFHESYFLLRLQDQVREARRTGREMCVAAVHVTVTGGQMTADMAHAVAYDMARIASSQSRLMSQPLALSDSEFVFSLPNTGANETRQFVREIMRAFGDYWCYFGIAAFPRNATDPVELVERARAACERSLQSGKRGQVEYSSAA